MIPTMNSARLRRCLCLFLALALSFIASSSHAAFTNSYVKAIDSQLKKNHAGNIATASTAQLDKALKQVLASSATAKSHASNYVQAILGNRADAASIDASVSLAAMNAAGPTSAAGLAVVRLALSYAPDKAALLHAMAAHQRDVVLDALAEAAVQSSSHNSTQARALLVAILNAPGITLKQAAAFAASAIRGAPGATMAKTVAEVVAATRFVSNQATFAQQLAASVSSGFASSIAIGVAHSAPVGSYARIVGAVVAASPETIANAPAIAGAMVGAMQLEFANSIVTEICKQISGNASFASLAPAIAYQVALKVDAKVDRSVTARSQEVASEAFALINALQPSNLASKADVCAVVTQIARAVAGVGGDYADAVIGSLYTAIELVQPNADFLSAVANAFVDHLPSALRQSARNTIAAAKKNHHQFTVGPLPSKGATPVVAD